MERVTDVVEEILDSAERRIRLAGFSGFSFREVGADVGVSSAAIHYHYPTKDQLAAAVARRYNDRLFKAVEHDVGAGSDVVAAWRDAFRRALADGARMCLCGSLGATFGDLPPEVAAEVRRFFDLGVESLMSGGLSREQAMQVLATLEGAILTASVCGDATVFEAATAHLAGANWRSA